MIRYGFRDGEWGETAGQFCDFFGALGDILGIGSDTASAAAAVPDVASSFGSDISDAADAASSAAPLGSASGAVDLGTGATDLGSAATGAGGTGIGAYLASLLPSSMSNALGIAPSLTPDQADQLVNADVAGGAGGGSNAYGGQMVSNALTGGGGGAGAGALTAAKTGLTGTGAALGALAMLGSIFSKKAASTPYNAATIPGPSATAATQGPLFNTAANPGATYLNRSPNPNAITPGSTLASTNPSWYQYGSPTFFNNNQWTGFAGGGALSRGGHAPAVDARHSPMYLAGGDSGGQDDDVPAMLSNKEYVIDATTMADAGDGNPDAGAKFFDRIREEIRKDKGRKKTVPGKIKKPEHYVAEAAGR